MTKTEVAKLVAVIAAAFPGGQMREDTVKVYESMLADLDCDMANGAVARLLKTSKWLPTIAEIRTAAFELEQGARRLAGEAWGDVLSEIRRVGHYGIPRFIDARTAECVRLMGWRNLCLSENDAADRARFAELYDGLTERAVRDGVAGAGLALPPPKGNPIRSLIGVVRPMPALPPAPSEADRRSVHEALKQFEKQTELVASPEGPSDDELRRIFAETKEQPDAR